MPKTSDYCSPLTLPLDHVGLYIHVPFCVRKCRYCDFASQPLGDDVTLTDRYLDALAREASERLPECDRPVHAIFIGGGTPSVLSGDQLRRLWADVIDLFPRIGETEVTIEVNPGTLRDDMLEVLAALPITRVSMGAQSFQQDELAMLGRIHTAREIEDGVAALRRIGIPRISLDLMYALPGQTAEHWEDTLSRVLALAPDHLSAYALILEDGTPLTSQVEAGKLPAPSEEDEERIVALTAERLRAAGYRHYEVSNAARDGAVCRHNLGYWLGRDYLGLGPSATSTVAGVRWRNVDDVATYVERRQSGLTAIAYVERLSARERLLERVMLGLRLRDGFNLAEAEAGCGYTLEYVAAETVAALIAEGLLDRTGDYLRLTPAGFRLANLVVTRLMHAEPPVRPA